MQRFDPVKHNKPVGKTARQSQGLGLDQKEVPIVRKGDKLGFGPGEGLVPPALGEPFSQDFNLGRSRQGQGF